MPTYVSGNGGYISISVDGVTYNRIDVATWTLTRGKRLSEITNSATQGSSSYHRAVKDNSWRLEMPWDADQEDLLEQIDEAEYLWIRFTYGDSGKQITLAETTSENFEVVDNNASDVVRASLNGRGGRIE